MWDRRQGSPLLDRTPRVTANHPLEASRDASLPQVRVSLDAAQDSSGALLLRGELPPSLPLGTIVILKGRAYRFCGVTPASIQPTMALLKDLRTGSLSEVPVTEIQRPGAFARDP